MKVHCCLFDRSCWRDRRQYGMPMRLHLGERFWTILPSPLWFREWLRTAEPVEVRVGPENKPLDTLVSIRLTGDQVTRMSEEAKRQGLTLTQFIVKSADRLSSPSTGTYPAGYPFTSGATDVTVTWIGNRVTG